MNINFNLEWLSNLDEVQMHRLLLEYRFLVRRFVSWVALIIARTDNNKIRQLLIKNILEECGENEENSHIFLLDKTILSTGYKLDPRLHIPYLTTKEIEHFFYSTFNSKDVYKSLCVLGPATEAISSEFLSPFKKALITVFNEQKIETKYFDLHLSEIEKEHAASCEKALQIMELEDRNLFLKKHDYVESGIKQHQLFWEQLKLNLNG
jgi:pyrroloquinoline quinone (PQQ) biosynthesis protein C